MYASTSGWMWVQFGLKGVIDEVAAVPKDAIADSEQRIPGLSMWLCIGVRSMGSPFAVNTGITHFFLRPVLVPRPMPVF